MKLTQRTDRSAAPRWVASSKALLSGTGLDEVGKRTKAHTLESAMRLAARGLGTQSTRWVDGWLERARRCRFHAVARAIAVASASKIITYCESKNMAARPPIR